MFTTSLNNGGHGALVESYENNASWYRIYSDGWCEQGGTETPTNTIPLDINLLKTMKDTNYHAIGSFYLTVATGAFSYYYGQIANMTTSSFQIRSIKANDNCTGVSWEVKGYIS